MVNAVPSVNSLSSSDMIKRIYELALERYDNDPEMMNWANSLNSAGTTTAKGQIYLNIINAVSTYTGTVPAGVTAKQRFNDKVTTAQNGMLGRATDAVTAAYNNNISAQSQATTAFGIYDAAVKALGVKSTITPPTMTAMGSNLTQVMRYYALFGNQIVGSNDMAISDRALRYSAGSATKKHWPMKASLLQVV